MSILTLLDDQVGHGEGHGVAGEDVVAAVNVFAIDGQSSARQQSYNPPRHICNRINITEDHRIALQCQQCSHRRVSVHQF